MRRILPLLLALFLCLVAVSCEGREKSPSSDPPEESSQSSDTAGPSEPASESGAPAVTLSDAEKARLQALIDYYGDPTSDKPSWVLARPSGIYFYYDRDGGNGIRNRVLLPDIYTPENSPYYDFYITLEVTAVALGPTDEMPMVTVAVSHDKAQTWDDAALSVEEVGNYSYCHIAFRDDNNGLLVLFNEEGAVAYSSEDGGKEWAFAGSFTPPGWFHDLCSAGGQYFIIGNNNGCPIVSKSSDGVHWEERILPPDRDYDQLFCDYLAFDDNIGFAVVPRGTNYATVDYGETWFFVKDLL